MIVSAGTLRIQQQTVVSANLPAAQLTFLACEITSEKQRQSVEVYVRRKTGAVVGVARIW
jgi:hypothetical protein